MTRFEGKVAIITGSSSGIGAGTALLFAKEGAKVTITGRKIEGLENTKRSIIDAGGKEENINVVVADITDPGGREEIVTSTANKFGGIDILVNNAGGLVCDENGSNGIDASLDTLRRTLELNTYAAVHMVQLARPYLIKAKGEIVNVSSIAGQPRGTPKFIYYSMAKAAIDQLTRGLAVELISEDVRVNSVVPGAVVTKFCQHAGMPDNYADAMYKEFESSAEILPIREIGMPEDIANVIAFLADRRASRYVIGQAIVVDGGSMLTLGSNMNNIEESR